MTVSNSQSKHTATNTSEPHQKHNPKKGVKPLKTKHMNKLGRDQNKKEHREGDISIKIFFRNFQRITVRKRRDERRRFKEIRRGREE